MASTDLNLVDPRAYRRLAALICQQMHHLLLRSDDDVTPRGKPFVT